MDFIQLTYYTKRLYTPKDPFEYRMVKGGETREGGEGGGGREEGGRAVRDRREGMGGEGEKRREGARERRTNERTDTWRNREMEMGDAVRMAALSRLMELSVLIQAFSCVKIWAEITRSSYKRDGRIAGLQCVEVSNLLIFFICFIFFQFAATRSYRIPQQSLLNTPRKIPGSKQPIKHP